MEGTETELLKPKQHRAIALQHRAGRELTVHPGSADRRQTVASVAPSLYTAYSDIRRTSHSCLQQQIAQLPDTVPSVAVSNS